MSLNVGASLKPDISKLDSHETYKTSMAQLKRLPIPSKPYSPDGTNARVGYHEVFTDIFV